MKFRIAVDPDAAHEATLIERDRITGRDINVFTAEPGEAFEFDISADTFIFAQQGRRVSDDGDGGGGGGGGVAVGTGRKLGLADTLGQDEDDDLIGEDSLIGSDSQAGTAFDSILTSAADAASAAPPASTDDPRDATDDEIRELLVDLESSPSVERTAAGSVQVATINKALAAKGFKPIDAKRRDELAEKADEKSSEPEAGAAQA